MGQKISFTRINFLRVGFQALVKRCLDNGETLKDRMILRSAGDCLSPLVVLYGNNNPKGTVRIIENHVPCRACINCKERHRAHWWHRAKYEMTRWGKAWFLTYTYNQDARLERLYKATKSAGFNNAEWQHEDLLKLCGQDLTKSIKRLRKNNPDVEFKYLFVFELHKDGFPHIHGLIFTRSLTKRDIEQSWSLGFTKVKLVKSDDAIGYVTKYLSKDVRTRIRASLRFGHALS